MYVLHILQGKISACVKEREKVREIITLGHELKTTVSDKEPDVTRYTCMEPDNQFVIWRTCGIDSLGFPPKIMCLVRRLNVCSDNISETCSA